jgi:hypothetical protein
MTLTMNEAVAKEVIRARVEHRHIGDRPRHTRTSRALRGLAHRLEDGG